MAISAGDVIPFSQARANLSGLADQVKAGAEKVITKNGVKPIHLLFQNLTEDERTILADGCLINYYKEHNK